MPRSTPLVAVLLSLLAGSARAEPVPTLESLRAPLRDAVVSGVKLLREAATNYPTHRQCFSCHHQTLPMLALRTARSPLNLNASSDRDPLARLSDEIDGVLQEQSDFTRESFRARLGPIREGRGVGGGAMTVGYALWALELGRCRMACTVNADETVQAMLTFLEKTQKADGHWSTGHRPPLEESAVTCTALAARALDYWGGSEDAVARARDWLKRAPVTVQEDRTSRLYAVAALTEPGDDALPSALKAATATQNADGGWSSRDDLPSDAYATGQTLVMLFEAGMRADDPVYRRGVAHLLTTRQPDGSWKVETRSKPIQVYFDNGDPHGKHQFISTSATSWAVAALAIAWESLGPEPYDLVVKGGRVVDGTGNPWFRGDVAVRGDRIVVVGTLNPGVPVRKEIDATGLVVAPGFIDIHSHSDTPLLVDGAALGKVTQGVTTEVLGEDTSGGPALGKLKEKTFRKGDTLLRWSTLGGYFDAVEQGGTAVNVASYVGLGSLLGCVLGDALDRPSADQLNTMKTLLGEAMRQGALGLSTMLAGPRELNVTTDDLVALGGVVRKHGGIFSSHIRNEGTDVLAAIDEAIAVGERAGIPVDVIHIKIADQALWGRMDEIIRKIDAARERGVDVQANVYPYTRGNNDLVSIVPPWAHEGGKSALLARIKDPAERSRIKRDVKNGLPGWYNHYTAVGGDWSRMLISARLSDANARFQGKTMDVVLAERGKAAPEGADPLDLFLDFLAEEGGSVSTIYAHHTEADMNRALVQPWCSIGSDGSALAVEGPLRAGHPHPRNFGTFPRVLGVYVREKHLLTLEDAVRKMTALNASKIGLRDRGLLRPGMAADLTVFDPDTILDRSTYLEPFHYSEGVAHVIVNGVPVLSNGRPTGARPGRALRH